MTRSGIALLSVLLGLATIAPSIAAAGEAPNLRRTARPDDPVVAALLGALVHTRVDLDVQRQPTRAVLDALRQQVDATIIVRYADDPIGDGLDPEALVTLRVAGGAAIDVLEEVIAQCATGDDTGTWQVRRGFIEVGTKTRLSAPAARERRIYYVADAIMDIPDFDPTGRNTEERDRRESVVLDVIATIVETVEPGAWDYGQPREPPPPSEDEPLIRADVASGPGATAGGPEPAHPNQGQAPAAPPRPPARPARRYVAPELPALIRYWRDFLIIDAPDYIHRQIGGYPEPEPNPASRPSAPEP